MTPNDLNDSLDGLFGKAEAATDQGRTRAAYDANGEYVGQRAIDALAPVTVRRELAPDLKRAAEQGGFFESCRKCGGSGRFGNWGACFACQGKGKLSFKTSTAERAKKREQARVRTEERQAGDLAAFAHRHPEIYAWMNEAADSFPFAQSMLDAVAKFGDLTERQLAACEKCVAGRKARQVERAARVANAPVVDVSRVEAAFAIAREKAFSKNPNAEGVRVMPLKLQVGDPEKEPANAVTLSIAPGSLGSEWEGMLFVKNGEGKKLGHVKGGTFRKRFECTDTEQAAVLEACSDPKAAAIAFGQAWRRCAVCSRELTNGISIEAAMGPVCRSKFGW